MKPMATMGAVVWLTLVMTGCSTEQAAHDDSFPIAFEVERLDGEAFALADLRGKVVLVDLFGTWCPPCQRSMPVLVNLYKRYQAQGFEIVGLAYERVRTAEEAKEMVRAFADRYGISYTLALGTEAVQNQVPGGFEGFPTMLLVDREGKGRYKYVGFGPGEEKKLAIAIEALLAEGEPEKN